MIKNLFKEDFSRRKPADLQALAVKLVQQAADAGADPTARFVLLRLAAEVAAKGGDAADALQAIDVQAKEYAVNAVALKAKALEATLRATGAPIDYQAVLDAALPAADETQAADDFDSEARLLRAAQVAATKLGNKPLAAVASERGKMVEAMEKEHENIKADLATLKDKPDDPDASLHVGRFLCFYKGEWDRGLPLLAVGGDAKLERPGQDGRQRPLVGDRPGGAGRRLDGGGRRGSGGQGAADPAARLLPVQAGLRLS